MAIELEVTRPVTRIAVIGIGSAGLAQLKQTRDVFTRPEVAKRTRLELVGFETRDNVGGLWNLDRDPKPFLQHVQDGPGGSQVYRYPVDGENPTAFYDNLRATLPGDLMAFRDLAYPSDWPEIPLGQQVHDYLELYTDKFDLRPLIRFQTAVKRLYHTPSSSSFSRKWTLESAGPDKRPVIEEYDFVSVCNGHYTDPWFPKIQGLSSFPGQVIHSREYRRAEDFAGKTILVVGSGNSGADIVRQTSSLNLGNYTPTGEPLTPNTEGKAKPLPFIKVYNSVTGASRAGYNAGEEPWIPFIHLLPPISSVSPSSAEHSKGLLEFETVSHSQSLSTLKSLETAPVDDVDVIIFATGYNNTLPFCKVTDAPWNKNRMLDGTISEAERVGGDEWEAGGLKGLKMGGLDNLLLFLEEDRTIAFPGLTYQITPFPFGEAQSRLAAHLWASLLPSFPARPIPPPNTYSKVKPAVAAQVIQTPTPPQTPPPDAHAPSHPAGGRVSETTRGELTFPPPYEWIYTRYLFKLMEEGESADREACWRDIEEWRIKRREDSGLRKRLLGY